MQFLTLTVSRNSLDQNSIHCKNLAISDSRLNFENYNKFFGTLRRTGFIGISQRVPHLLEARSSLISLVALLKTVVSAGTANKRIARQVFPVTYGLLGLIIVTRRGADARIVLVDPRRTSFQQPASPPPPLPPPRIHVWANVKNRNNEAKNAIFPVNSHVRSMHQLETLSSFELVRSLTYTFEPDT